MQTRGGVGRFYSDARFGVFERQADGVNGLNNAVVQIHAKPFAFLQNGELLFLAIQLRVLNRDGGLRRKHFQHLLVLERKFGHAPFHIQFVAHVQIANDAPFETNRHAQKRSHYRMMFRETDRAFIRANVGHAQRRPFGNQYAQQTVSARRFAQTRARFGRQTRRHELFNRFTVERQHAQRAIARIRQFAREVNHFLQDDIQIQFSRQRHRRVVKQSELLRVLARFQLLQVNDAKNPQREHGRANANRNQRENVAAKYAMLLKQNRARQKHHAPKQNGHHNRKHAQDACTENKIRIHAIISRSAIENFKRALLSGQRLRLPQDYKRFFSVQGGPTI
ncbi:MAG: hypothetical protein HDKAJFGB_02152 [Anaerolineae bacterium]|nr:hypothetical protein [Anaerolineae bacterium]